ncbi:MAG: hypothetical protein ACRD0P_19075 [Stackebrandtia sp.]
MKDHNGDAGFEHGLRVVLAGLAATRGSATAADGAVNSTATG